LISREDRWASVLENLRTGVDRGIEYPKNRLKHVPVTILGRKMGMKEAACITGLQTKFFSQYKGQEVPVEDIITQLENKWMKEKTKMLRTGLSG
jgi:hypothetical protein